MTSSAVKQLIRGNTNISSHKSWLEGQVDPQPGSKTHTTMIHLAAKIAKPANHIARRDHYLWSTDLATIVKERRRLRVWQISRRRRDLNKMLID